MVAPVLHVFPLNELEVNVADCPEHNAVCEDVIVGVDGNGFTVTATVSELAEQPDAPTTTEYEPELLTVIDCVVAPVLHIFPLDELEVSVTLPP